MDAATTTTKTVNISAGWAYPMDVPATTVLIGEDGSVVWQGHHIGFVWKGERTYSPPVHKGSRIVKYHKQVSEWHGHSTHSGHSPDHRKDTRQEVVRCLIADFESGLV